jgi:hypothetical protein
MSQKKKGNSQLRLNISFGTLNAGDTDFSRAYCFSSMAISGPYGHTSREKWKPNLRVIKAVIQFVMNTERFQPKATIADDTGVAEGADDEASVAQEIGDARAIGREAMPVSDFEH